MDVLVIFMIFASISPFLFWRWNMRVVGLIQLPFIVGMWIYFVNVIMPVNDQPEYLSFWLVLFIGNLVFGDSRSSNHSCSWANESKVNGWRAEKTCLKH
ncbi:spore morphogenesis/germination protein YwcE [Aneurinibacillus tyrosinisolvens]|uniref:spore morphogenesis/germination protein YwcE n=1 Tax=Aneurinibacillus tyrosinisolvens TaxID=1443435 RepID=UPI00063F134A|nr:spore morphogenesis/germination protein YwcE [Aneurinibacillus tyrosinisolvens]